MNVYYYGVYDTNGGLENFAKNLIFEINKQDKSIHFHIITHSNPCSFEEEFLKNGCTIIRIPNPHKKPFKFYKKYKKIIKNMGDDDVIQLNICSFRNPFLFIPCLSIKRRTVVVGHYTKIDDGRLPLLHSINKRFFSRHFHCVTNSDDVTNFMFPKSTNPIFISNGVDLDKFKMDELSRKEIRDKYNISSDCFLIGQIGRIDDTKNQLFTIKVFEQLLNQNNKLSLCLAGKEIDKAPREYAKSHGLEDKIIWAGMISSGIEKYYSAFDLCVLPSKNEGLSLSLLESFSNGVDSIYSTAVPHLTVENNSIYLDLNINTWVKEIQKKINEFDLHPFFSKRKTCLSNTEYDLKTTAQKYIELYKRVVQ